jgi:hypothetical protein
MDVLIKNVANIIDEFDEPLIFSMKSLAKLSCKQISWKIIWTS